MKMLIKYLSRVLKNMILSGLLFTIEFM